MRSLDTYRTVIAAQEFDFTKGLEKGREEGRAEEKILSAKKMKSKGFSTEDIAEITGLTEEEINRI